MSRPAPRGEVRPLGPFLPASTGHVLPQGAQPTRLLHFLRQPEPKRDPASTTLLLLFTALRLCVRVIRSNSQFSLFVPCPLHSS